MDDSLFLDLEVRTHSEYTMRGYVAANGTADGVMALLKLGANLPH